MKFEYGEQYYGFLNLGTSYTTKKVSVDNINLIVELLFIETDFDNWGLGPINRYEITDANDQDLIGTFYESPEMVYNTVDKLYKYLYDESVKRNWLLDYRVKSIFKFSQEEYPEAWI